MSDISIEPGKTQKAKGRTLPFILYLLPLLLLALALRLLVWRWHEQYPLGGDEQEYFDQALTLLRKHRYVDLKLMRPPLYTGFLAGCIYLFDSLVQRLRLIQGLISALTVVPIFALTHLLFASRRIALLAALLAALSYTLAANATELLTETLFVFGLSTFFCLLVAAARTRHSPPTPSQPPSIFDRLYRRPPVPAVLAGLVLGALILLRSVALPLLPLGALWLLISGMATRKGKAAAPTSTTNRQWLPRAAASPLQFIFATILVVAPWTARNYVTYGGLILVDTTGAENLWLDNNPAAATPADPLGREAAKQALYALGDDRVARQRLATGNAIAAISANPEWFAQKAWGEATKFFALQYFDDMRDRRAIWVPLLEVWLRLLFGDGLWLVLLLGGVAGLWLYKEPRTENQEPRRISWFLVFGFRFSEPRWLFVPWALYTLFTAMLFHVELRYRLPLYPVLLPYAAWTIVHCKLYISALAQARKAIYNVQFTIIGLILTIAVCLGFTLLHRPYLPEAWMLAQKHIQLWQAERALGRGDAASATTAATAALTLDGDSALARVALARAKLLQGDQSGALAVLDQAIRALMAHPYAHLLRGAILREQGDGASAADEFAYERSSQEDLQRWSWETFASFASVPGAINIGTDDLGFTQGFWLPEDGTRWSRAEARIMLHAPAGSTGQLALQLNAGRPAGAPAPTVSILVNNQAVAQLTPTNGWHDYTATIPAALIPADRRLLITIRSDTFRPRDYDHASPDIRELGVLIKDVHVVAP